LQQRRTVYAKHMAVGKCTALTHLIQRCMTSVTVPYFSLLNLRLPSSPLTHLCSSTAAAVTSSSCCACNTVRQRVSLRARQRLCRGSRQLATRACAPAACRNALAVTLAVSYRVNFCQRLKLSVTRLCKTEPIAVSNRFSPLLKRACCGLRDTVLLSQLLLLLLMLLVVLLLLRRRLCTSCTHCPTLRFTASWLSLALRCASSSSSLRARMEASPV
jgi:hypothetical protein